MNRAQYVESLKVERAAIESRPADHPQRARRLADIDAELDRYAAEPTGHVLETAAAAAAPVAAEPEEKAAPEPEPEPEPEVTPEPAAAAKTAAAAKRAAARKAAAKKTAAKK